MTEEEQNANKSTQNAPEETVVETKNTTEMIDNADRAADRLDRATERYKAENDRAERIAALNRLGGGSPAGQEPVKEKEETPVEYAKRIMEGKADVK